MKCTRAKGMCINVALGLVYSPRLTTGAPKTRIRRPQKGSHGTEGAPKTKTHKHCLHNNGPKLNEQRPIHIEARSCHSSQCNIMHGARSKGKDSSIEAFVAWSRAHYLPPVRGLARCSPCQAFVGMVQPHMLHRCQSKLGLNGIP